MINCRKNVEISRSDIVLHMAPIHDNWILDGNPIARNSQISKSLDGTAHTMIWDCTAGTFNWFYDRDETFQVLEGSAVLTIGSETREIAPGTCVFFPAGSQATWRIDSYIRKVAFVRQTVPRPFGLALRVWDRGMRFFDEMQRRSEMRARRRAGASGSTIALIAFLTEAMSQASFI